jgi:dUTP pyrophosphatase
MSFQEPKYLLRIKVVDSNLTAEQKSLVQVFYETFLSHHNGDSGVDLYNMKEVPVDFLQVGTIDFSIQCEMVEIDTRKLTSYYLAPRSSISKTPFQLANSMGIIDAGYRGNLMAKVRCFNTNGAVFPIGSQFQIIAPDLKPIVVQVVDSLSETSRGDGGFGSTNK